MRYQYAVDTGEEFVDKSEGKDPELKKELTRRETQSIADQFYRGLYWYLQDYWASPIGKESVFGGRDSAEFSHLYDTMKAVVGVRSNPTIQKVIMAGNNARKELREVLEAIARTKSGLKRLGIDPDDMLDRVASKYGSKDFKEDNLQELEKRVGKDKRTSNEPGFASGVNLYFLVSHRDQLLAQIRQKQAMNKVLSDAADIEYKVSVLNSISAKTKDPSLKREIEQWVKGMEKAMEEEIKSKKAVEEAKEVSLQAEKTRMEVPLLQEAIEESKSKDVESPAETSVPKVANYRDDPNFDLTVFYGDLLQSKITSIAAMHVVRGASK